MAKRGKTEIFLTHLRFTREESDGTKITHEATIDRDDPQEEAAIAKDIRAC